jgi:hypothetical protein
MFQFELLAVNLPQICTSCSSTFINYSKETILKKIQNHVILMYKIILLSVADSELYSINICPYVHTTPHKTLAPVATLSDNTNSSV